MSLDIENEFEVVGSGDKSGGSMSVESNKNQANSIEESKEEALAQ